MHSVVQLAEVKEKEITKTVTPDGSPDRIKEPWPLYKYWLWKSGSPGSQPALPPEIKPDGPPKSK
jgi:hypothetical protein